MTTQATAHRIATPETRPVAAVIAISSANQGNVRSILAIIFVPPKKELAGTDPSSVRSIPAIFH
jgi:hypothetical protein